MTSQQHLSTGLPGLDSVLDGLRAGDNVVWQMKSVEDFPPFVAPFCRRAVAEGRKVVYFRYADHPPLLAPAKGVQIIELHPEVGFETFIFQIRHVIEQVPAGSCFVFDCLSDLAVDWYSDQMLGNFFQLICPCLLRAGIATYFVLLKNTHSFHAMTPIGETTQILLEIYCQDGQTFVHPTKVEGRYSQTINMLHRWASDDAFIPITNSTTNAQVLTASPWLRLESASAQLGVWNSTFINAEQLYEAFQRGECSAEDAEALCHKLLQMAVSRDPRVLQLLRKYFTLADVLTMRKRMIGTGLVGGKSIGMLLARAILRTEAPDLYEKIEPHDSFFIGSDVFYTFLVRNDLWWARSRQRDEATCLDGADKVRHRMLEGTFPAYIRRQFADMLDYFGQSPFIVRSSSLLEDSFGNAFAGKYDSVFCANQGPRHERLEAFTNAVRVIYASSMSERALTYRSRRGLLQANERMALLVQRVSGADRGGRFFPHVAGVGLSYNPYVWSDAIDPKAGVLWIVFGLGTRAVERHDDDYTRIVALNAPSRLPEMQVEQARQYTQRRVDVLNLQTNRFENVSFAEIVRSAKDVPFEMFTTRDLEAERRAAERNIQDACTSVLTFEKLLGETDFVEDMRHMLAVLQQAYEYPVDVEFTLNHFKGRWYINLVQCRPYQIRGGGQLADRPEGLKRKDIVLEARGAVIGHSRDETIDRIIYVVPDAYAALSISNRHAIARLIGEIARLETHPDERVTMLLGPGRWGTTMPALGVPVNYADINTIGVICEIVAMREDLVPDVSLGTHLFNEMVEMQVLYLALFPGRPENRCDKKFFEKSPNKLAKLLPTAKKWQDVVRVIDPADLDLPGPLHLYANTIDQQVVCYIKRK